ncbi:GFA family protein [Novosphingobium huizhouense]|uniref:GFA family protein n=1 Tax=Novosphingobium huizhouense TaxID=2866625 RepID=UPI001CD8D1B1|nr:GFA family protein [Novosphingobium huizhouense]
MRATCQCGQLVAEITGETDQIVACHCRACQKRSGSPFGVLAYFPAGAVTLSGEARDFARAGASGAAFVNHFSPTCGATVWCDTPFKPDAIGIPVGAFADPGYPAPVRSVWEETRHDWVAIPGAIPHFPRGRS